MASFCEHGNEACSSVTFHHPVISRNTLQHAVSNY
jgi:hypothetical protein